MNKPVVTRFSIILMAAAMIAAAVLGLTPPSMRTLVICGAAAALVAYAGFCLTRERSNRDDAETEQHSPSAGGK